MKNLFFVLVFTLTSVFIGCAQQKGNESQSATLSAKEFQAAILQQGVQVLDVRSADEYKNGHLKNALLANWNDPKEFQDRTQHLDKSKTVYVYCQAGGRSAAAQSYLIEKGFKVINLEGGLSNWKMNNFPVEGNSSMAQMEIADFEKVIKANELVLVDIGATWCPPCRKMQPIVDKIKQQRGNKLYLLNVDGGNDMEVMKHLQFESLPTFIVYKKGVEVWRQQGIVSMQDLEKALQ
jgi:rhodanese-related sulfurtransferase